MSSPAAVVLHDMMKYGITHRCKVGVKFIHAARESKLALVKISTRYAIALKTC